ncbi:MAG: prepilin-type N-terminal cleavage/methylation domain-containing protein [Parcubacteria group bacterium]|nr:prepilin-type N-terminal cleavage/methylation domain-containing protein [Parcubacteria group bacterium]
MQKAKNKNQSGFSLLETLVAVAILTGAVLGPLALASQSIRSSGLSQDRIAAFFLAQEAMEFVRNRRDENGLLRLTDSGRTWLSGLEACRTDINADGCIVDPFPMEAGGTIAACSGSCPYLPYGTAVDTERYGYDIPSFFIQSQKYRRTVYIEPIQEDVEVRVRVIIEWVTPLKSSGTDSFTTEERLFNWI